MSDFDGIGLENRHRATLYRGFEPHPFRQINELASTAALRIARKARADSRLFTAQKSAQ
jgi:hypothetical protein